MRQKNPFEDFVKAMQGFQTVATAISEVAYKAVRETDDFWRRYAEMSRVVERMRWERAHSLGDHLWRVRVEFEPRDFWVGVFVKRAEDTILGGTEITHVYVTLVPMFPLHFEIRRRQTS